MKKILSVILTLTLILSLCVSAGIPTGAKSGTDGAIKAELDEYWNSRDIGSTPETNFIDIWDQGWAGNRTEEKYEVTKTVVDGIGAAYSERAVKIDCEKPNGMYINVEKYGGRWDVMTHIKTWTRLSGNSNTFMIYVQFPTIDESLQTNVWHRFVELMYITVYQNNVSYSIDYNKLSNISFEILSDTSKAWETITVDSNRQNEKLNGFKGYIKIDLKELPTYDTWVSNGFDATKDCQISQITFKLPMFGGNMGAVYFGGIYNIEEDADSAFIKSGDNDPIAMTSYDFSAIVATSLNRSQDSADGSGAWNFGIDQKDNSNATVTSWAGGICPIDSSRRLIKIANDEVAGFNSGGTNPKFKMNVNTVQTESNSDIMLYIELPTDPDNDYQAIRSKGGFVGADYKYYPSLSSLTQAYSYLENNSNHWVDGNTDSNHEMKLPNGFKGYIKIHIGNTQVFKERIAADLEFKIYYWSFCFGKFGGDIGDVKIGGVWLTDTSLSTNICLDNANKTVRLNSADQDVTELNDVTSKISGYTVTKPFGTLEPTATYTIGSVIAPIGNSSSVSFNSELGEGQSNPVYDGKYKHAQFNVKFQNTFMDHKTDTLIIYVELPNFKKDGWGLRISNIAFRQSGLINQYGNNYVFCGAYKNSRYSYIEADGTEWKTAVSDGGGGLTALSGGFKGYIKIDFNDMVDGDSTKFGVYTDPEINKSPFDLTKDYTLEDFAFQCGSYGGDFGPFKIGGFYTVGYDNGGIFCKLDGGSKTSITTYTADNEQRLEDINTALGELEGDSSLSKIDMIDKMYSAYDLLSAEYKETVTADMLSKMASAKEKYSIYRPTFLGSTVKANCDTDVLELRIDTKLSANTATSEGYSVVKYGTVLLNEEAFRDDGYFDSTAVGANLYENSPVELTLEEYIWKVEIKSNLWTDLSTDVYARSYVVYSKDGKEITVWNNDFTNHKEERVIRNTYRVNDDIQPFLRTSFAETANALGVPICMGSVFGDVDGNAVVSSADMVALRKLLLGITVSRFNYTGDVDDNNVNDIRDLVRLKKYFADTSLSIDRTRGKTISAQW